MRDLLPDNIALVERLEAPPTHRSPAKASETRGVGALATWETAFSNYIAVVYSSSAPGARERHAGLHAPSSAGGSKIWRHWVDHI